MWNLINIILNQFTNLVNLNVLLFSVVIVFSLYYFLKKLIKSYHFKFKNTESGKFSDFVLNELELLLPEQMVDKKYGNL